MDMGLLWALVLVYLAVTMFLGYLGWKKTKVGDDYLLAGRKVNPIIIGLSYGATFISTSAIVGFGGYAANAGMGLIWLTVLNIGVGILVAFIIFGKRTNELSHKLKAFTFPDLIGKAFQSRRIQLGIGIIILVGMPLYVSAVMIGGSQFVQTTMNIPYEWALIGFAMVTAVYVVFGGLRAVMYTDAMQGAIMIIGLFILLIFTYSVLGGVTSANAELTSMAGLVPSKMATQGMAGWTAFPDFGSPLWLTMVTTIILGVGVGVLAEPQLNIRFMTAKDSKALNRAIPIGAIFILITTGVAYTVGPLTNVYFFRESGKISVDMVGGNVDKIMPTFINAATPELFVAVFMIVLLAAAMSTLSSIFHTMGSAAGHDIWTNIKHKFGYKNDEAAGPSLTASRTGTAVMMVVSVLLAFAMPPSIIARATAMWFGLASCAILPTYIHMLFSKKKSIRAAQWSIGVGAISWFLWTALVHKAESSVLGISQALFGTPALFGLPWTNVDPLVIALPISLATLGIVWYLDTHTSWGTRSNGKIEDTISQ